MSIFYLFQKSADYLTFDVFGLLPDSHFAESVNFFIYDSFKILFLILFITYLMTLLWYYLPIEKIREFLVKHRNFSLDYFFATIFVAITPFCLCSLIPPFIGFI